MSDIVIHAENLSKRYRIGERERYLALRDVLTRALTAPFRLFHGRNGRGAVASQQSSIVNSQSQITNRKSPMDGPSHIWALKDVSFDIHQGEVVGIIGRNGAGKTTLLKILARVTKPTAGFAEVRGRMGSLLEVGTGFHPELTGRENTFLNGAILGMSKKEIEKKFDEIVAFAEIEKFIDTPVKHYSSGMQVRLAFSVAAHLEPEILLVDEVLAVGDAAFQKKCLGKMGDVAKQGRTILFVSHSMASVSLLCSSAIVLGGGRISTIGPTQEAIAEYLGAAMDRHTTVYNVENSPRYSKELNREAQIIALEFEDYPTKLVPADADLHLQITVRGNATVKSFRFALTIFRIDGLAVGTCFGPEAHSIQKGEVAKYRLTLPNFALGPGLYNFGLSVGTGNDRVGFRDFDGMVGVLHFEMLPPVGNDGTKSMWNGSWWGSIRLPEPVTTRCS
jgi:lipopolysaccharide transport system ATP-binding protein